MEATPDASHDWLVRTKLVPPALRNDVIARGRLLDVLAANVTGRRLTLLSAPAGYGKSTLLASLQTLPGLSLAWLSLDQDDNDPTRFISALMAGVQRLNSDCGATAQALLAHGNVTGQAPDDPGAVVRRVLAVWINDLLIHLPQPFVLALDDLHLITAPMVYVALDYLIEHQPPQMHLALATRHDPPLPLARWRARGELAELRLAELRFTLAEEASLFNDCLRLDMAQNDLAVIQGKTEGWPAGLRLIATSLQQMDSETERAAFVAQLARTDRYVFDLMADEVLDRVGPRLREFLLATCILAELTPTTCAAVTGWPDAGELLREVDRDNLFLIAVDETGPTYRYHALFAEFLRQRLAQEKPPEAVAELHRRAALAQNHPPRAIGHYLAAQLWEPAVQLILPVGWEWVHRNLLSTTEGWISALPAPVREAHLQLNTLLAYSALQRGETGAAQALLERAVEGLTTAGDEPALGEALALLASCLFLSGDLAQMAEVAEQALAYPMSPGAQVQLRMARAFIALFMQDQALVQSDVEAALALTESGDLGAFVMLALYLQPDFAAYPGILGKMERFCEQARRLFGALISPLQLAVSEIQCFLHLWRGRLDAAAVEGERALAIKQELGGYPFLGLTATLCLALVDITRGNNARADPLLERMVTQCEQVAVFKTNVTSALYFVAWSHWLQRRFDEASAVYRRMTASAEGIESPESEVLRPIMGALVEMAGGHYPAAERMLREAVELQKQTPVSIVYANARLALASLYHQWNRPDEALAEFSALLARCAREQTPGLILKEGAPAIALLRLAVERNPQDAYAAQLLGTLGIVREPHPITVPETGETLTAREVEILRLIAAGESNREIACHLSVSEPTVKSHIAHLYQKLAVSSRTQAAARARALRIV